MKAPDILHKAAGHMRDRAATYDKPEGERSMAQTVAIFNLHHGTSLTEAQGWHFMQILKDVRMFTRPGYHADSGEDGVAYAALKCEAKAAESVPVQHKATRRSRDDNCPRCGLQIAFCGGYGGTIPCGSGRSIHEF